jgi:two-component system, NtrC family, sensor histidine kinase KinB
MRSAGRMTASTDAVPLKRRRHSYPRSQEAVSLAAHDMKTPLSVLNGYVELLLSERLGLLNEQQREILLQMQASGERLEQVVEDSLSFSALKAGSFRTEFQTGHFDECIAEVAAFWGPCFIKRNIKFQVKCAEGLPTFKFDSHKTQRVLSNLLENAMRFAPAYGNVTLASELCHWDRRNRRLPIAIERRSSDAEAPNAVRISVTDDGPGIAAEHHQDIFNAYVRLVQPGQKSAGTGLGLAIARNLVTALRGKIWVESEIGYGSRFVVVLPLKHE